MFIRKCSNRFKNCIKNGENDFSLCDGWRKAVKLAHVSASIRALVTVDSL